MNKESNIGKFSEGETSLHFVIGTSGFIMKELTNESATVYCWESAEAAEKFIAAKFSEKQRPHYSVNQLNSAEFYDLKRTIKFLPEEARVHLEIYESD